MQQITLAWPCRLKPDADGRLLVRFRDFPEALTDGADEAEAFAEAADALAEAVAGRLVDGEAIPEPRAAGRDEYLVPLEALLAYKVALAEAMRAEGLTNVALAKALGVDEKEVRRLLDPGYRGSRVPRLAAALAACGVLATVAVIDTAKRTRLFQAGSGRPTSTIKTIRPASATRLKRKSA